MPTRSKPNIAPALTEKEVEQAFRETKKRARKYGKSYEIYKASQKPFDAIDVDGKRLRFGEKTNALRVRDKKLAMDIKQALGGRPGEADVVVAEVDDVPMMGEEEHKNFFGSHSGVPWGRYDEFGRRIEDDGEEEQETSGVQGGSEENCEETEGK